MSAVMEKTPSRAHSRNKSVRDEQVTTRLAVLETRWEDIVPTLATKADLGELRTELERSHGELRTELHKMDARITRWMLTTIVALFVGFAGMFFAQQRNLDNAISRLERLYIATQSCNTICTRRTATAASTAAGLMPAGACNALPNTAHPALRPA